MHALILVCRVRAVHWVKAGASRDRHQGLCLCCDGASMHLCRSEESLYVVLFDHGTAMDGHTDDAWDCALLFINTDVKGAIPTGDYRALLHVSQVRYSTLSQSAYAIHVRFTY